MGHTADIDRRSPIPFYFQLARLLRDAIVAGRWEPGSRIQSEPELCAQFGLSRSVVRQALATLEVEGLVRRIKGRGTFVADARSRSWLLQSSEGFFHEEVDRMGLSVTSEVLRAEVAELPAWAAGALGKSQGSRGAVLERLRWVDGRLALYVLNYLPEQLAEAVFAVDAEGGSLYEQLAARHGLRVFGGRRVLEAVSANARLAEVLDVDERAPLAHIESVSWDTDLQPFDCYQAWLRTDRMRVEIQVLGAEPAMHAAQHAEEHADV
jgi:GntR family transcriptional regulator